MAVYKAHTILKKGSSPHQHSKANLYENSLRDSPSWSNNELAEIFSLMAPEQQLSLLWGAFQSTSAAAWQKKPLKIMSSNKVTFLTLFLVAGTLWCAGMLRQQIVWQLEWGFLSVIGKLSAKTRPWSSVDLNAIRKNSINSSVKAESLGSCYFSQLATEPVEVHFTAHSLICNFLLLKPEEFQSSQVAACKWLWGKGLQAGKLSCYSPTWIRASLWGFYGN